MKRTDGLLGNRDFLKLWVGQTISVFGSSVSTFALPMTAILVVNASPMQMGLLQALGGIPYLLTSLLIGVLVDRVNRRSLMIAVDLGRAFLIGLIPFLALLHWLNITHLYLVTLAVGILSVAFDTAYQAYLPFLVGREQLIKANSSLQFSQSLAQIGGPGISGLLVSLLAAPLALAVDAISFLVSATALTLIGRKEPASIERKTTINFLQDIREGLKFLYGHPVLSPLTLAIGCISMCFSAFLAVYYLYLNQVAGLTPSAMGLILSAGALGSLLGSFLISRISSWLGSGPTIIAALALFALAAWLVPLSAGPQSVQVAMFTCAALIAFFGGYSSSVTAASYRQTVTPDHLLGRVSASAQIVLMGLNPIGALIGGALGEFLGLRSTLMLAALGISLMVLWLWFSPVRTTRAGQLAAHAGEKTA